ncbi:hypothetical protein GOBAR_AA13371 [Gossypium barbadense]|uniref:Uncharacterized protein n=1 Tax=Gossypium barbadense TaxID=3634 RepID=A0A2P5XVC4_GOSBA|nr:hypothetical protein GOBAR_AA13371 [Gossypium barbadense]
MGGGAWPFLVGGVICLVNSVNERDISLLTILELRIKLGKTGLYWDFNSILNEAEKEGGHRRLRAHMNEFKVVMDDLALVDIKPDSGWEAKKIIGSAWNRADIEYREKMESVRSVLGYWQCKKYGKMKSEIQRLEKNIDWIIDSSSRGDSVNNLKEYRKRLNFLYAREESY